MKKREEKITASDKQRDNRGRDAKGRFAKDAPTAFKPGRSGNPKGRPKSITLSEALRNELAKEHPDATDGETYAEKIAAMLCESAAGGNVAAAREIADRTEGKPRQALDVDMNLFDWRAIAKAQGVSEQDVIAEAKRIIAESAHARGGQAGH